MPRFVSSLQRRFKGGQPAAALSRLKGLRFAALLGSSKLSGVEVSAVAAGCGRAGA